MLTIAVILHWNQYNPIIYIVNKQNLNSIMDADMEKFKAEVEANIVDFVDGDGYDKYDRLIFQKGILVAGIRRTKWRSYDHAQGLGGRSLEADTSNGKHWVYSVRDDKQEETLYKDFRGAHYISEYSTDRLTLKYTNVEKGRSYVMKYNKRKQPIHYIDNEGKEQWWEYTDGFETYSATTGSVGDFQVFSDILPPAPLKVLHGISKNK